MTTLTRILIPVTFFDVRTGRFIRAFGAAWWLLFEELPPISSVPIIIAPSPPNPFDAWRPLFELLAYIVGLITFTLVLTCILMWQSLIRIIKSVSINSALTLLNLLAGLAPERQVTSPSFVTVNKGLVLLGQSRRMFSTSAIFFSLSSHVPEISGAIPEIGIKSLKEGKVPRGGGWYETFITHPHDPNFWTELEQLIRSLMPGEKYGILLQPQFEHGGRKTLGGSFHTDNNPNMDALKNYFEPIIASSEDEYNEEFCLDTRVKIVNLTGIEPSKAQRTRSSKGSSQSTQMLEAMQNIMQGQTNILEAIKVQTQSTPSPLGVNWTPIIQGALTGLAQSFGAQISFPTTTSAVSAPSAAQTPGEPQVIPSSIQTKLNNLDQKFDQLTSIVDTVAKTQNQHEQTLKQLSQGFNTLSQVIAALSGKPSNNSNGSNSGSTPSSVPSKNSSATLPSSPPSSPDRSSKKSSPPEITAVSPYKGKLNLDKIVTADLESIITPEGFNQVYMAAWFNGKNTQIYDITSYNYDSNTMLKAFWLDLINNNKGGLVYFHNWAGYDAILSLLPLLNLHEHGFTYSPIMQNGQLLSLTILQKIKGKNKSILTIKDSLKMIPGALGKLAKDFQVETQKDHFPHYFILEGDMVKTLNYEGVLPNYDYFEPKRTSLTDYDEMVKQFKGKSWSFLKVSKQYIKGDVQAQHQIIIKFFNTLKEAFPINPLTLLSAPGTAFKIWKTVQLPLLNKDSLKVYDLSRSLNNKFREAYLGGIVDVYRPYFEGQKGYYYDVNSLYPTAMCRPMPVGIPILQTLNELNPEFFGFVEATVQAPSLDKPGGYIGLLPIKHGGRLVCPGGIFSGFFFSEELRFALDNGYKLIKIGEAYQFQRGDNTFKALIEQLNQMKVKAQLEGRPVLRNIAKLLMNSMYGRFGMHTPEIKFALVEHNEFLNVMNEYLVLDNVTLGALELVTYALDKSLLDFEDNKGSNKLRKYLRGIPGQTNVPIAAAVTAYSRMIINGFKLLALKQGLDIYYSDTDSLVVNGPLPSELCDSAKLGMLKLEHTFKEGIFAAPKIYYLKLEDGSSITKCKGYSGKLSQAQYLELFEGKALNLLVTRWKRSLMEGRIQIKTNLPYVLNPLFNKREKVFDEGKWVNTKPIILS